MCHVAKLVHLGHAERIVLGHDVFVKAHLHAYGGNGYDHLFSRVIPELERTYGVDVGDIDQLLVSNPSRLLACSPPGEANN